MQVVVSKVSPSEHADLVLDLFNEHRFAGVFNAKRVFETGRTDLWLAYIDGTLVGALLAVPDQRIGEDGTFAGFENCLVIPRLRQRGLAVRLMAEAEEHYRSEGLTGIEFAIRADFEMKPHLLRAGYEVVRQYKKDKRAWDGTTIGQQTREIIRKRFSDAAGDSL